jgi:murein DD-endopeptidase MepM/ murein hydrolase activator NlpD
LISLLLALAVLTADQGTAVRLAIPAEPGVKSVDMIWQEHNIPFVRVEDQWVTIIGVDLDVKAGEYKPQVLFTMEDDRLDQKEVVINVASTAYPTTELTVEEKFVQLKPPDAARATREAEELTGIFSTVTREILWDKPFSVPIPEGTGANFGHRRVFNGEPRAPHAGADLRAKTGTPIHSTNRGRVVLAKNLFFTGNTVIVDHGLGIYSLYAHLSRIDVKPGAIVKNGEVVGLAGATGRVTGPHLHWGIRAQNARVDPFSLVEMEK